MNKRSYRCITLAMIGFMFQMAANAHENVTPEPTETLTWSFAAHAVSLRGFSARLLVRTHDKKEIRLRLSGPRDRVRRVMPRIRHGDLEVDADIHGGIVRGSVRVENSIVITQEGGTSNVVIGGISTAETSSHNAMTLFLTVPRAVPITIEGYSGDADIANLSAPLSMQLLSGRARIGHLVRAYLAIAGSGEISVDRIDGALDLSIDGAGNIDISDGIMPALSIQTDGSARIAVGGRVGQASLMLAGDADIWIARTDRRPDVNADGIANVVIGNW